MNRLKGMTSAKKERIPSLVGKTKDKSKKIETALRIRDELNKGTIEQ